MQKVFSRYMPLDAGANTRKTGLRAIVSSLEARKFSDVRIMRGGEIEASDGSCVFKIVPVTRTLSYKKSRESTGVALPYDRARRFLVRNGVVNDEDSPAMGPGQKPTILCIAYYVRKWAGGDAEVMVVPLHSVTSHARPGGVFVRGSTGDYIYNYAHLQDYNVEDSIVLRDIIRNCAA